MGVYEGIGKVKKHVEHADAYETRTISFYLKGAASPPSSDDFLKMKAGTKNPNISGQFMLEYYKEMEKKLGRAVDLSTADPKDVREFFASEERQIKRKLSKLRNKQNRVKLVKLLTRDWWEGLTADAKGEYSYFVGDDAMILRSKRAIEYV